MYNPIDVTLLSESPKCTSNRLECIWKASHLQHPVVFAEPHFCSYYLSTTSNLHSRWYTPGMGKNHSEYNRNELIYFPWNSLEFLANFWLFEIHPWMWIKFWNNSYSGWFWMNPGWIRRRPKTTSKLRVTGLCVNSPVRGEFPVQMASNMENVSIWCHHKDIDLDVAGSSTSMILTENLDMFSVNFLYLSKPRYQLCGLDVIIQNCW